MPEIALRLSGGMLPAEFFQNTIDPVELHDARIQTVAVNGNKIALKLHSDDNGGLREIEIQYDCTGFAVPVIPTDVMRNKPGCDLMCHESVSYTHLTLPTILLV